MGAAEDKTVRWHYRLNGHALEQTLGDHERQGSLASCSPWGRKESDKTQQLNNSAKLLRPQGDNKTTKLLAGITSGSSMKELKV